MACQHSSALYAHQKLSEALVRLTMAVFEGSMRSEKGPIFMPALANACNLQPTLDTSLDAFLTAMCQTADMSG